MRQFHRVKTLACFVLLTIGTTLSAKPDDNDENREASLNGGDCSIEAVIAVEAADVRERFEEFERELTLNGLLGNNFQNPEVVEQRIGQHHFSDGLSAHQTLFAYLAKNTLSGGADAVSGHAVLKTMREYFGEPLHTNLLFPFLKQISIDPTLAWADAPLFFGDSFAYLEKLGMEGHGFRRKHNGEVYSIARIEGELFLYIHQPSYAGARKGRLGVFEWRRPHKPVGRPEHIAVFAKYLLDHDVKLISP